MNRKYTPEQEENFKRFRAAGKSVMESSKLAGVPVATAMKWNVKMKRGSSLPKPAAAAPNLSEVDVPKPAPGQGGVEDGAGAGGAQGARTAKVDGEEVEVETVGEGGEKEEKKEEEKKKDPQMDPAKILIGLCKMATYCVVRFQVRRAKLDMDDDFRKISKWTKEEEAELMETAPATAAALGSWLVTIGPYVAPAFFFYGLMVMMGDRVDFVKQCAEAEKKGKAKPKAPERPPDPAPGSKEEREAKEKETIEDPLPNGYTPSTATATDDLDELMKGSFYSKSAEKRWTEDNKRN
jgi:hypothetical protein